MPRKARVPHSEILEKLKNFPEIFDAHGDLLTASNNIWTKLAGEFNQRISAKYLHFCVQQNRCNVLEKLRIYFNIQKIELKSVLLSTSS